MPLQPQVRIATLKTNVNLKTTVHTKQNIGDSTMVSDTVEARVLGIPGTSGTDGKDGIDGAQALNWQGVYDINTSYIKDDLVNLDGVTFIYISDIAGIIEIPSENTTTWNIFTGTPQMRKEIDELPSGDLIIGQSLPDSELWEAKWSIKKVLFVSEDLSIIWADNVSTYTKIWDSRLTYFP